ncbi:MAG: thermosome subunit [Candidatus Freyarchaeota archaeon]|nr:thermosome subunit [Candidatus Jordarchaeia archaeon]
MSGRNTSPIFKPAYRQERDFNVKVLKSNIMVASIVSHIIRNTIGPYSVSKAILKKDGEVLITGDAFSILKTLKVEHPIAKILIGMAKAQDAIVGDGVATAVILAGELLKKAEILIDQGLLPSNILKGYDLALKRAVQRLEEIAIPINPDDEEILRRLACTALNTKVISSPETIEGLSSIALKLAKLACENGVETKLNLEDIKIVKKRGGFLGDSKVVDGYVIEDREIVHPDMPRRVENANIALVRSLELKEITGSWWEAAGKNMEIQIEELEAHEAFLEERRNLVKQMVSKLALHGVNVVLVNRGIDEITEHYLARAGILAVKRVFLQDMNRISRLTGAHIISDLMSDYLTADRLGQAKLVEEWRPSEKENYILITGCPGWGASSVIMRGGNQYALEEAERGLHDALQVVRNIREDPRIIPGGGASEMELSKCLKDYAQTFSGKEQLAILAYSEALRIVPQTLADNAGLDPLRALADLRMKHSEGMVWAGLNVNQGEVEDMEKVGILEPIKVKVHALNAATDVARIVLRIDEVIPSRGFKKEEEPKPETEKKAVDALKKVYELEL